MECKSLDGCGTHPGEVDLFDVFIVEEGAVALQYQQMAVEFVAPDTNNAVGISIRTRGDDDARCFVAVFLYYTILYISIDSIQRVEKEPFIYL